MKNITVSSILFLAIYLPLANVVAEPVQSYKQVRDQMMQKNAGKNKKKAKFSQADRQLMKDSMEATKKKYPSPGLALNTIAPDFSLPNATGSKVRLSNQLKQGPVVLVFYRGAWCPFCNLHLHVLQKSLPEFKKYKASLIAVTPQQPDQSLKQIAKNKYPFEVLSDLQDVVMKQYGLYYELSPELVKLYKSKGLDVEAYNGKGRTALPIPGTFVIARDGRIRAVHAQHDYKERMEPAEIIRVLKTLKPSSGRD